MSAQWSPTDRDTVSLYRVPAAAIALSCSAALIFAAAPKPPSDPKLLSCSPAAVRAAATVHLTVRGNALDGAHALIFQEPGPRSRVIAVHTSDESKADTIEVELDAPATPGSYRFRAAGARGLTNELTLHVLSEETRTEEAMPETVTAFPFAVAGTLAVKGQTDRFWFNAASGQTLTFTCEGASGSLDPALALVEQSGSWFDKTRLNRIAFNDEPLHFPGLSNAARLMHRFEKGGRYAIEVRGFSGQGGPDATYVLHASKGTGPEVDLHPPDSGRWDERRFTRAIPPDWLSQLAVRGASDPPNRHYETFRAAGGGAEPPLMTAPGLVEGVIAGPGETHRIRLRIPAPQDLALEIETPRATMPRFNPVVRLLAPDGTEMVTNVYTKRNNNGLYMMKMIQAKSTFTLRAPGDYTIEIRDITTDVAGDDFAYRVLVRPQTPHIGKVEVAEDRINLEPGQAKSVTVTVDREEEFRGLVLVSAEGLPPGVTATAGLSNPDEKPPLPNGGRRERYVSKPQVATLVFEASADAPPIESPATARITVRTVSGGVAGAPVPVKEIPVMVVPRRPS